MEEKVCRRCQESWPADNEFYKTESDTMCIACHYERNKEYKRNRYRTPEQRERHLAKQRQRYAEKMRDPVWRERERLRSRQGRLNQRVSI
jgi:uncharacterized Fe-S cluster-containing protein